MIWFKVLLIYLNYVNLKFFGFLLSDYQMCNMFEFWIVNADLNIFA